jgi:hypothetical protein
VRAGGSTGLCAQGGKSTRRAGSFWQIDLRAGELSPTRPAPRASGSWASGCPSSPRASRSRTWRHVRERGRLSTRRASPLLPTRAAPTAPHLHVLSSLRAGQRKARRVSNGTSEILAGPLAPSRPPNALTSCRPSAAATCATAGGPEGEPCVRNLGPCKGRPAGPPALHPQRRSSPRQAARVAAPRALAGLDQRLVAVRGPLQAEPAHVLLSSVGGCHFGVGLRRAGIGFGSLAWIRSGWPSAWVIIEYHQGILAVCRSRPRPNAAAAAAAERRPTTPRRAPRRLTGD